MSTFLLPVQVRWSDLDPNFHIRHSVYYDWGALTRVTYMEKLGLTTSMMQQLGFGLILFREECVFLKEIRMGDTVQISLELLCARHDFSRWTIRHSITKNENISAAQLTIEGAWLDTAKRKLALPPPLVIEIFSGLTLAESFNWSD